MKKAISLIFIGSLLMSGCTANAAVTSDKLDEVVQAVKEAYSQDYGPNLEIERNQLKEIYGIDPDNLEYFVAEGPEMSMSTDMMFALLAKEDKIEEVKTQVEAYQEYLINESFQYPMNMARVKASQIVVKGNAIFLLVLGKFDERQDSSEEEALEFALEQVQIAVDVIEDKLG